MKESTTIQANAGIRLDALARDYAARNKTDYRTALFAVSESNRDLMRSYHTGAVSTKRYETLTLTQSVLAELHADPERTQRLASYLIDKVTREKLTNVGKGVDNPVELYRRALVYVKNQYPNLARAAQDGFLADDDYKTAALLVPSVAGEVERGKYQTRCQCGEHPAMCRGKKLAKRRGVDEDDVASLAACIRDAQAYGDELDAIACLF